MAWKKKTSDVKEYQDEEEFEDEVKPQTVHRERPKKTWSAGMMPQQVPTMPIIINQKTGESLDLYEAIALLLERTE